MQKIHAYKGRSIDSTRQVLAYFNLHLKVWSIKQDNQVVAHAEEITLKDCTTKVYESGRQRVIKERKKNVHAYLIGYISTNTDVNLGKTMYYNPYKVKQFVDGDTMQPIDHASLVKLNSDRTVEYI